jgi:ferredoxin
MTQGITARTHRRDFQVFGSGTLLEACQAAGLPVASSCLGRGACGKCLMTILAGQEHLAPPSERELVVLKRNLAEPGQRLGCQCPMPGEPNPVLLTTGYW